VILGVGVLVGVTLGVTLIEGVMLGVGELVGVILGVGVLVGVTLGVTVAVGFEHSQISKPTPAGLLLPGLGGQTLVKVRLEKPKGFLISTTRETSSS
jgi:hypothetical protein